MPSMSTIARPYAKALFQHAVQTEQFEFWSEALMTMAWVISQSEVRTFISNPRVTQDACAELMLAPFTEEKKTQQKDVLVALVSMLVAKKRLPALPEIYVQFCALRDDYQKTICVTVKTFSPLSHAQEAALKHKLVEKLNRQVELQIEVDETLLGGLVVQAGDLVINGSVQNKLQEMYTRLTALG